MFPQLDDTKTVFDELCEARKENTDLKHTCEAAEQCINDFIEVYKRGASMLVFDEAVKSLRDDALAKIKVLRKRGILTAK